MDGGEREGAAARFSVGWAFLAAVLFLIHLQSIWSGDETGPPAAGTPLRRPQRRAQFSWEILPFLSSDTALLTAAYLSSGAGAGGAKSAAGAARGGSAAARAGDTRGAKAAFPGLGGAFPGPAAYTAVFRTRRSAAGTESFVDGSGGGNMSFFAHPVWKAGGWESDGSGGSARREPREEAPPAGAGAGRGKNDGELNAADRETGYGRGGSAWGPFSEDGFFEDGFFEGGFFLDDASASLPTPRALAVAVDPVAASSKLAALLGCDSAHPAAACLVSFAAVDGWERCGASAADSAPDAFDGSWTCLPEIAGAAKDVKCVVFDGKREGGIGGGVAGGRAAGEVSSGAGGRRLFRLFWGGGDEKLAETAAKTAGPASAAAASPAAASRIPAFCGKPLPHLLAIDGFGGRAFLVQTIEDLPPAAVLPEKKAWTSIPLGGGGGARNGAGGDGARDSAGGSAAGGEDAVRRFRHGAFRRNSTNKAAPHGFDPATEADFASFLQKATFCVVMMQFDAAGGGDVGDCVPLALPLAVLAARPEAPPSHVHFDLATRTLSVFRFDASSSLLVTVLGTVPSLELRYTVQFKNMRSAWVVASGDASLGTLLLISDQPPYLGVLHVLDLDTGRDTRVRLDSLAARGAALNT